MEIKSHVGRLPYFVFAVFLSVLLTNCSSTKIAIDVMRPPVAPMSESVESIALINRVGLSDAQTIQYVNGQVVAQFNGVTDVLIKESFIKMKERFSADQIFVAFDTTLNFIPKNGKFNGADMPPQIVKKACLILGVDALVVVEAYTADLDTDNEVNYSTPVDRLYGTVRVPYFDGEQSVDMQMLIKSYLCSDAKGYLDEETLVGTQISMSASGSTPYEVRSRMAGAGSILIQASHRIGADYAERIGPYSERDSRKIYTAGNDQMAEAYRYVDLGSWREAADIWHLLATSNNAKLASHASYNLILANEVFGDYKQAQEWASICISKYQMKDAEQYQSVLNQRVNEMNEIKRLFPTLIY